MTKTKRIRRLKATIKSHVALVNAWAMFAEGLIQDNKRLYVRRVEAEDKLHAVLEEARSPKQKLASAMSEIITNSREAGR